MSTREKVGEWLEQGKPDGIIKFSKKIGVSTTVIYRHIKALRPDLQEKETESLLERCRSGDISDESANRILGRIMADGKDADRIKAIDIHDARNRASSSKIGPPPPHSPQQIIDRLTLIFKAAAPEHVMEAAKQSGYQMVPSPTAPQAQEHPLPPGFNDPADEPPAPQ